MLDLKGGSPRIALDAVAAARQAGALPGVVSSRNWRLLAPVLGEPELRVVHSAANRRELRGIRRMLRSGEARSVCVRRDLIDPGTVAALREDAELVMVWQVREAPDARRMLEWGVNALVCDDLRLIAALAAEGPPTRGS
jgi:hypothetical protein